MFMLTIKELAARKLRLLTTAFAVLLGVAFMAGTLVFTDTIGATFDSVLADADEGVDAYVRAPSEIDLGYGEPGPRLDASLADDRRLGRRRRRGRRCASTATPSSSGPTASPSATSPRTRRSAPTGSTVDDLNPYELAERARSRQRRRDRHRQGQRRQGRVRTGRRRHRAHQERAAPVHDRRHRHVRFRPTRPPGRPQCCSPMPSQLSCWHAGRSRRDRRDRRRRREPGTVGIKARIACRRSLAHAPQDFGRR